MFDSRYSEEAINRINSILGAGHRVKPYDLTSAKDLKDALLATVAAYRDYRHYTESLAGIAEDYDESLEYCETTAWLDLSQKPENVDALTVEGFAALGAAADVFEKLTERAEKNCATVVKAALSAPPATQKAVLGRAYKIAPKDMDAKIAELFEMLGEAEYHKAMPDNLKTFLEVMEEVWTA
jgi:hypothetical protein